MKMETQQRSQFEQPKPIVSEWQLENMQSVDIQTMDEFVIIQKGSFIHTFKGPKKIYKKDIETLVDKKDLPQLRFFQVRHTLLKESTKHMGYNTLFFDYVYDVSLQCALEFSIKIEALDIVKMIATNKYNHQIQWTFNDLVSLYRQTILRSLIRQLYAVIGEYEISILDFHEIIHAFNEHIREDLKDEVGNEGLEYRVFLKNIEFKEDKTYKQLENILFKAKKMDVLDYTYKDEHHLNFIEIVDADNERKDR